MSVLSAKKIIKELVTSGIYALKDASTNSLVVASFVSGRVFLFHNYVLL